MKQIHGPEWGTAKHINQFSVVVTGRKMRTISDNKATVRRLMIFLQTEFANDVKTETFIKKNEACPTTSVRDNAGEMGIFTMARHQIFAQDFELFA